MANRRPGKRPWPRVQPERLAEYVKMEKFLNEFVPQLRPEASETIYDWMRRVGPSFLHPPKPADVPAERQPIYGHPALNFSRQAAVWNGLLANKLVRPITAEEVAILMAAVKLVRLIESPTHEDSIIDVGGYMACLEQVNRVRRDDGALESLIYGTLAEKHYNPESIRAPGGEPEKMFP